MSKLDLSLTQSSIQSMSDREVSELVAKLITIKAQDNIMDYVKTRATNIEKEANLLLQEKLVSQNPVTKEENDSDQEGGFTNLFIPKIKNIHYGGDMTPTENNKNIENLSETSVSEKTALSSESSAEDNLIKLLKANDKNRVAAVAPSSYVSTSDQNNVKVIKNDVEPSSETSVDNNDLPDTEDLSSTSADKDEDEDKNKNKNSKYYSDTEGFYTTTIFEGESETKGVFNDIASGAKKLFNYINKALN